MMILKNIQASPNIIRVIQLRMMRGADHMPRMEELRNIKFRTLNLTEKYHSEEQKVYRCIRVEWVLGKCGGNMWTA
jgi:hypothetical protein